MFERAHPVYDLNGQDDRGNRAKGDEENSNLGWGKKGCSHLPVAVELGSCKDLDSSNIFHFRPRNLSGAKMS